MKYTQIPTDTFQKLQMNAGMIVKGFVPATGEFEEIVGATSGGIQFQDNVSYVDFGDDIDNCPKDMKELKKIDKHEVTMSGSYVTVDKDSARSLAGAADIDEDDETHIVPRNDLDINKDFDILWINLWTIRLDGMGI